MNATPSFDKALVGETLVSIVGAELDSGTVELTCASGTRFRISDVYGSGVAGIAGIRGTPTLGLVVECVESDAAPEWLPAPTYDDTHTWTVFRFTVHPEPREPETVTFEIAFLGTDGGYYTETVSLERVEPEPPAPAPPPPFDKSAALVLQAPELEFWRPVLTPPAFEKLAAYVTRRNAEVAPDASGFKVIRSDGVANFVATGGCHPAAA